MKQRIVLLGFLSHFPVAGVAWQTVHYLIGLQRLGFDVYYVEAHGCTPTKVMQNPGDDGPARAADYIARIMCRFELQNHWAYHSLADSRYFGLTENELKELYRSAALIINLHGSHLPMPEFTSTNRLIYLETDPVNVEIDLFHNHQETIDYLSPHCAFFTFGENIGNSDCLVPVPEQFKFIPTRQPVVMDFWENSGNTSGAAFTTIGNWRQPWREVSFRGEVYHWSKHFEFEKFIDLPGRTQQPFELALSSYTAEDQRLLENRGWMVRHALDLSGDLDTYHRYIADSRGEFTVAKDQNVRLRSGWFSDRAVTYLAAGRPVVSQETAFSNILPTGEGLFAFSAMDEIVAAVETINADYEQHRRAARDIAKEYFSHDVVLTQMLRHLGIALAQPQRDLKQVTSLPPTLVVLPTARWPTTLAEATKEIALSLPAAQATTRDSDANKPRVSIVIATHNGLPYTKMCVTSLFANEWNSSDELIVVDNASTDATPDYLRELARLNSFVRIIFNKSNTGFAPANNQGLAQAAGDVLILLNNDTLVVPGWREPFLRWLEDPAVGMVGPVTNRCCNEAQIEVSYQTLREMEEFAYGYTSEHRGKAEEISMLAMFCVAMRRDAFEKVGALDEQFEIGMFEDDDYAMRMRDANFRLLCVEDVFVHHFGQASFGSLLATGEYERIFEQNRRRLEEKWSRPWQMHGRRVSSDYERLRERIHKTIASQIPAGAIVLVVSKGDDELLNFHAHCGWHFPQLQDGTYSGYHPVDGTDAVTQLEDLRRKGADYFLIPNTSSWWLQYYSELTRHLEAHCPRIGTAEDACTIFSLREKAE